MPNKKIKRIKVSGETYDITDANAVQKSGDTMTGDLSLNENKLKLGNYNGSIGYGSLQAHNYAVDLKGLSSGGLNLEGGGSQFIKLDGSGNIKLTTRNASHEISADGTIIPKNSTLLTTSNIDTALSTTSTNPVQNKVVKAECDNIRAVAEGKCATFVCDMSSTITLIKTTISLGAKCYDSAGVDISAAVVAGDYDNVTLGMNVFDVTADTVEISSSDTNYYILNKNVNYAPNSHYYLVTGSALRSLLKLGDIILISKVGVPDRWYGGSGGTVTTFYALEATKVDLSQYVQKTGDTMTGSLNIKSATDPMPLIVSKDSISKGGGSGNVTFNLGSGGMLKAGGSDYGYVLPASSSLTANKTIATTDQIPSTDNFVAKTGDTMTGDLIMSGSSGQSSRTYISAAGITVTDGINSSVSMNLTGLSGEEVKIQSSDDWYASSDVIVNGKTGVKVISNYLDPGFTYNTRSYYVFGNINETEGTAANPATVATREWTQDWVTSQAEEFDYDTVVTALGYEPVNKAGDTITGDLYVEDDYQTLKISGHSIEGEHSFPLYIENIKDGGAPISIRSGDSLQLYSNQHMSLEAGTETNPHVIDLRSTTFAAKGLMEQCYEVDSITRPTSYGANHVVYHVTIPGIQSLRDGMRISVHKGLASENPNDSNGALKLLQINDLAPIAIFWRYNSMATWNQLDNAYMTLTYCSTARPSTSNYYGYTKTAGFIMDYTYDSGNDVYNFYDYGGYKTGPDALQPYTILGWNENNERVMLFKQDGTLTNRKFDYTRGVFCGDETKTANTTYAPWNGSFYRRKVTQTILQACVTKYGLQTLAVTDLIYAKCTKDGRYLTCVGLTKALPTTADGYYYMLIAKPYQAYTAASNQLWTIEVDQPVLFHNGTTYVELSESAVDTCVKKTGDTMTGELKIQNGDVSYEGKLSLGGGLSLEAASGYANINSGYALTLSTPDTDIAMESHYISLSASDSKVNISDNTGITFDSKIQEVGTSKKGYYTLPSGDGSTSTNRYTLATQEWVTANAGGATNLKNGSLTGSLYQIPETTSWTGINETGGSITRTSGATGEYSLAIGSKSLAEGKGSLAGGTKSYAGKYAVALGDTVYARNFGVATGYRTIASGDYSHAEGSQSVASAETSHAEGIKTKASAAYAHAEGSETEAKGNSSHAEGIKTVAEYAASHAEGNETLSKYGSHSEGYKTEATGHNSHTEGCLTRVLSDIDYPSEDSNPNIPDISGAPEESGSAQNPELWVIPNGYYAHAEGYKTVALGAASHAEGNSTKAIGKYSHAQGELSNARHKSSFVSGTELNTSADNQTVFGTFNADDSNALLIVGNGNGTLSNAFSVNKDGSGHVKNVTASDTSIINVKYLNDLNYPQTIGPNITHLDLNSIYDYSFTEVKGGRNTPDAGKAGVLLTLPYRQPKGNTKPDFGVQIYATNGDDPNGKNIYFRTSMAAQWDSWQTFATKQYVDDAIGLALTTAI